MPIYRPSVQEFITLWDHRATNAGGEVNTGGELFKGHLWGGDEGLKKAGGVGNLRRAQKQYFEAQWQDTLGFIGTHTHTFTRSLSHTRTLSHTYTYTPC